MSNRKYLGEFEFLVVAAVLGLKQEAYSLSIRDRLSERVPGRSISTGAVYSTLTRLEEKGLLESWLGDPTPERGGKPKRFYRVRAEGEIALRNSVESRAGLVGSLIPASEG
jgi:DNA-binding PadR family transcriptional regulator